MKKTKILSIFALLFTVAIAFYACKQTSKDVAPNQQEDAKLQAKTFAQNRLIFDDVAEFEGTMNQLNTADSTGLVVFLNDNANFTPLFITKTDDELEEMEYDDESITYILNTDEIVQIGNWVYKIDMIGEKVYAMQDALNQDENDILNQKQAIDNLVFVYDTYDEVLDLTQLGEYAAKRNPCGGETCLGYGKKDSKMVYFTYKKAEMRAKCKVKYQHAGIYKSLISKAKIEEKVRGNWDKASHEVTLNYEGTFKKRCKNTEILTGTYGPKNGPKHMKRHYSGTRCLAALELTTRFYGDTSIVTNPYILKGFLTKLTAN